MPQDAKCPSCSHGFPVTEARHPFTVTCPRCEAMLTVEFKKPAAAPEAGQPPYELAVKPGAAPDATAAAPRPKKRKEDDDEEEKQRGGGSALIVLLSGGLGLTVVLAGLALTGWFLFTQVDTDEPVVRRNDNRSDNRNNNSSRPNNNSANKANNNSNKAPNDGNTGGTNKNKKKARGNDGTAFNPGVPAEPKDHFDLRPVAGTLTAIQLPADLDVNVPKSILLPGRADAVAVGGGGRYIVFHFPEGRLAVFDANTGDVEKEVAVPNGGAMMTAGANTVVTNTHIRNRYSVYSLPDLKKINEFELPLFHGARSITMGAGTNGPMLAVDPFGEVALMDVNSGKPVEGAGARLNNFPNPQVRASHDGKLFLAGNGYGQNDKFSLLSESLQKWQVKSPEVAAAYIGADGKRIYGKDQIVTTNGNVVATKPAGVAHAWFVPAVTATGDYFLRVNAVKVGTPPRTRDGVSVSLHKGGDANTPVLPAWEGLPETDNLVNGFFVNSEPLDRHLFLIPEAKLLVILNRDKSKLVVRKLPI
jgi:hypothetical protein